MKKLYIFVPLALFAAMSTPDAAEIQKITTPVGAVYRMNNDKITCDIDPQQGGRIINLRSLASGGNLTSAPAFTAAPGGSGMLCDRIQPERGATAREYEKSPYRVVSSSADATTARLALCSENGPLTIEKAFLLPQGAKQLQVTYTLSNPAAKNFTGSFWSCSAVRPASGDECRIFLPAGKFSGEMNAALQSGGITYSYSSPKLGNYFVDAPQRDYAAATGAKEGVAITAPFEYLGRFYSYQPDKTQQSAALPTLEFFTEKFVLKPLAQGKADAVNHPEATDPLADYLYIFSIMLEPVTPADFNFARYRPEPKTAKSTRFQPRLSEAPAFTAFTTPAIPFLTNPANPPKMLAVCNIHTSAELLEFLRRVKFDLSIVEVSHPHLLTNSGSFTYYGWTAPDPAAALTKALERDYDIIMLSQTLEKSLPPELVKTIRAKVAAGCALVYIGEQNQFKSIVGQGVALTPDTMITAGTGADSLPEKPQVTVEKFGKGSVWFLRQPMLFNGLYWTQNNAVLPLIKGEIAPGFPYWEYSFAHYGKLLYAAAGRVPQITVRQADFQQNTLQTTLHSRQAMPQAVCRVLVNGQEQGKWTGALTAGDNRLNIQLPPGIFGDNGQYFCTMLLSAAGQSVNYHTIVRRTANPAGITALALDTYSHPDGKPVRGKAVLRGQGKLRLTLRDTADRTLARRELTAKPGENTFQLLPQSLPVTPLAELTAELFAPDGTRLDSRTATLTIAIPLRHKLNFVVWSHGSESPFALNYDRTLAEMGFDIATGTNAGVMSEAMLRRANESVMRHGMRIAPMSMHRISLWKIDSLIRTPCLRDPAYALKVRSDVQHTVAQSAKFCPALYYSGDENSLGHYGTRHDMCHSSHCLAAFRQAMRAKYGTLAKLNAVWRTNFTAWEAVTPPTYAQAEAAKNFTPWIEHRLFMMGNVSGAMKMIKRELTAAAPGARLGFSGQLITDVNGAFNWIDALPAVDNPTAYIRVTDGLPDLIRSFGHRNLAAGAWIGYGTAQPEIRWNYWRQIFNGMFSPSFWWYAYFIRRGDGQLTPDGEFVKNLLAEIRNSGAEQMFAEAEAVRSPVALFYSVPSLVAANGGNRSSAVSSAAYTADFNGWSGLLRDLGFPPPQVITHEQLAALTPEQTPILVLPMAQMLSDGDIAALRNYVRSGGMLIADAQPGVRDQFGSLRTANPLDDLFGIRSSTATGGDISGTAVLAKLPVSVILTGDKIEVAGGKALGEIRRIAKAVSFGGMKIAGSDQAAGPLAISHVSGRGKTLYLNFLLSHYGDIRLRETASQPLLAAFRQMLQATGVNVAGNHRLPPGSSVAEYRADGNRYFGVSRANGSMAAAELVFGRKGHLYDAIGHRYLGRCDSYGFKLAPHDVRSLALLPAKLESLQLRATRENGKFLLHCTVQPADVVTLLRLEVQLDGKVLREYTANSRIKGQKTLTIDPGMTTAPGKWTFRITDIFSGNHAEHTININPGE